MEKIYWRVSVIKIVIKDKFWQSYGKNKMVHFCFTWYYRRQNLR